MLQCAQVFLFLFAFQFYLLLLRLRVFGVKPLCRYAGIGSTVSNRKMMAVAVTAGDGNLRDFFTAGRHPLPRFEKQQFSHFYRHLTAVAFCKAGQEFCIRLLRLVDVRNFNSGQ
ncbi:hypothetical protein BY89_05075 [Escherichia coli O157:H7 str. K5607]|nr:hypothetical protein BY89_05075 [Escherichia coli O157:H7 str. K5607]EZE58896.1 hypothetical protein BX22_12750 [Escherichia coli O157:H7 str. 2009C-4258]